MKDTNCIYFLHHNEEIVYIGMSQNLRRRICDHRRSLKKFNKITYFKIDYWEGCRVERYLISKYKPKYNKRVDGGDIIIMEFTEKDNK